MLPTSYALCFSTVQIQTFVTPPDLLRCELAADRVIVHVHALAEAGLHIEGASRKRALFESVFSLPVEFAIAA